MITLHVFGPMFGLPDPSGFVIKTMTQLAMSGLPHRIARSGLGAAPKGKLPFIDDDGELVADSVFILDHLKRRAEAEVLQPARPASPSSA